MRVFAALKSAYAEGRVQAAVAAVLAVSFFALPTSSAPASEVVAVVEPSLEVSPVGSFSAGDADVTWTIAMVVFPDSVSGAVMPSDVKSVNRSNGGIQGFVDLVFAESEGSLGVRVDVFEASASWPGFRPSVAGLSDYDVVAFRYPKFSDEPMATDMGEVVYAGLAGSDPVTGDFWQEFPARVDSSRTWMDRDLLLHEWLHSATRWALAQGVVTDADLPVDNVHGQSSRQVSASSFYVHYLRGTLDVDGRQLGLGFDRLVQAGTPASAL